MLYHALLVLKFYTREEIIHWIISLILDIFLNCGFIKPYCTYIITFCPEMPIPKLVLEVGVFVKHHECTFSFYSHLVLKKRSKHSKTFGTSLNKSVTFFFKTAQACSMGFKSGEYGGRGKKKCLSWTQSSSKMFLG